MDRGRDIELMPGFSRSVCAFIMMFTGNMPQLADLVNTLRHSAHYGCRHCPRPSERRNDLGFDTVSHGRYYWEMKRIKDKAIHQLAMGAWGSDEE